MGRFRREKKNSLKFTTEEYQKKKRIRLSICFLTRESKK